MAVVDGGRHRLRPEDAGRHRGESVRGAATTPLVALGVVLVAFLVGLYALGPRAATGTAAGTPPTAQVDSGDDVTVPPTVLALPPGAGPRVDAGPGKDADQPAVIAAPSPAATTHADGPTRPVAAVTDHDCSDFTTQAAAQAYYDAHGYSAGNDPERLDTARGVGNGVACESLPAGVRRAPASAATHSAAPAIAPARTSAAPAPPPATDSATADEAAPVGTADGDEVPDDPDPADLTPAAIDNVVPQPAGGGPCAATLGDADVLAHVAAAGHHLAQRFQFPLSLILGRGSRPSVDSDHADGRALDFLVYGNAALGDALAEYAIANRDALGITYVIWTQRINDGSGWIAMPDRGNATANHLDHVHISFAGAPGAGLPC